MSNAHSRPESSGRTVARGALLAVVACLVAAGALAGASTAAAIPSPSDEHTLTQPDGTSVEAVQWGNEFNHGWETVDGYTITQGPDGWWWYATVADGDVVPTDRKAGIDSPPPSVPRHVRGDAQTSPELESSTTSGSDGPSLAAAAPDASSPMPSTGDVNLPVVLVNYSDTTTNYTTTDFQNLVFGDDPSVATGPGSVRDYFREVSYGQLDISGGSAGVTGWETADHGHDYYGQGTEYAAKLAREAVRKADDEMDFSEYDNNGDGVVDGVIVVHQGAGEETSGEPADIWSHRWSFSGAGLEPYRTDDGVAVNAYSLQPETQFGDLTTVGVIAHETGHLFGMTDLYDRDGGSEGIGDWGLMGGGSWNGLDQPGDSPAHPVAFHKAQQGWLSPTEQPLTGPMGVLEPYTGTASAFRWLDNPGGVEIGGSGEYFLASNRRQTGFDRALPGEGVLVTHVDESRVSNADVDHKLVDVEAADGERALDEHNNRPDTDAGDLFPGSTNARAFNATTTPNSLLYDGSESGLNVTDLYVDGAAVALNPEPDATVSPSPVAYGDVRLTANGSETVTVTNDGTGPLNVTNATLRGEDATAFDIATGDTPAVLEPGEAAALAVEFSPSDRRSYSATLVVDHNASAAPTDVSLSGTGVAPDVDVTPSPTVDFGNVTLEAGTGRATVVVENNGTAPLDVTDATVTGADADRFSVAADGATPPTTVSPGATVEYALDVAVDSLTTRTASLELAHDVPDRGPVDLALTATGVDRTPPTVRSARAVDAADGTATVGPGESVAVSAAVRDAGVVRNVTVDASALGAGTVALTDGDGDHRYDATVAVDAANATEGVHSLTVEATDTRANAAANETTALTLDRSPPTLDVEAPADTAVANATAVNVTGSAADALSGVADVEVRVDDGAWTSAALDGGAWHRNVSGLAEGGHTLSVRATDNVSNTGPVQTRNVTVDVSPPTVENATLGATDGVLPGAAVGVDVAATDAVTSVASVAVDGTPLRDGGDGWTGTTTAAPALGPARATVAVVDAAGNAETATLAYDVGRDAELRRVNGSTYRAEPNGATVVEAVEVNATANATGDRVTVGTATRNPTAVPLDDTALYFPQVNATVANENVSGATVSVRLAKQRFERLHVDEETTRFWLLRDGNWTRVSANATAVTDAAYRYDVETTHFSTFAVTGAVEDSPPTVTDVRPAAGSTTGQTPTIGADYADGFSGVNASSVALSVDGTRVTSGVSASTSGVRYAPPSPLAAGTHSATVEVADEAGNVESQTWTFTVEEPGSTALSGGGGGGGGGGAQPAADETTTATTTATTSTANATTATTRTVTTTRSASTTATASPSTTATATATTAEPTTGNGTRTPTTRTTSTSTPGLGAGVALVAALLAVLVALRRDA